MFQYPARIFLDLSAPIVYGRYLFRIIWQWGLHLGARLWIDGSLILFYCG